MKMKDGKILQLIRYGGVGAICTLFNLVLFWVGERIGIPYILANTMAYFAAACANFFMNKKMVFSSQNTVPEIFKFVLMRLGNIIVDNVAFYFCVDILGFPLYPSRVGLTAFGIFVTYFLMRNWVFGEEKNRK